MSVIRKHKELILGIAMLLIAAIYLYSTSEIQIRIQTTFNSRFVPYILGSITAVLGILQCASWYAGRNLPREEVKNSDPLTVVLIFSLIVVYIVTLWNVGFLISTSWLMFFTMMLLCPKTKRKPVLFCVISVITTALIYYSFRTGLQLMLPVGILG